MRRPAISATIVVLFLVCATVASADQIPDLATVYLFDGTEHVYHADMSGVASYGGMDAAWEVNDFSAEITFSGSYDSPENFDVFYVEWLGTLGTMPLSVNITSSTAGLYSIYPVFQRPEDVDPVVTMVQDDVAGDSYFGHHFPECDKISFAVYLNESSIDYEVTITMAWGTGVPIEAETWGGIKSLYR